uniref:Uncharacterized protein n=1 Tax=Candidatus Kentrum sp. LFY TaxID=2126342 RepID=A0A450UJK6_9GAMM|nr:MAG: hypothetical protein BECKLFY1418A_GA0070994_10263 [Candidatus Kentron sp. LFY]
MAINNQPLNRIELLTRAIAMWDMNDVTNIEYQGDYVYYVSFEGAFSTWGRAKVYAFYHPWHWVPASMPG